MKFCVGYFYKNVIYLFIFDRVLRMNINMCVLRTICMLVLCVIRN